MRISYCHQAEAYTNNGKWHCTECKKQCYAKLVAQRVEPLPLGTKTQWGTISAITSFKGERCYMMLKDGAVSLMPGDVVESSTDTKEEAGNE